jgi:hypothetical protein
LKIEHEGVVQVFLDVKRDLRAVGCAIVAELDFHGDIEQDIIVRMDVEGNGRR